MTDSADCSDHNYIQTFEKINQQFDWAWLPELAAWVIDQAVDLQQIPAPTFHEGQRAAHVARQFESLGLDSVEIDGIYNVYGRIRGQDCNKPALALLAHIDTVFAQEVDLQIRREPERIYGPGLGDNCMGVAGILGLARVLKQQNISLPCDVWFVTSAREEGLGDLGGIRAAYERLKPDVKAIINLEGLALGHVYNAGIAVRRLHISASVQGGHSWLHFGRASAIHGIIDLGARIRSIKIPRRPRTTYNIGMIDGGQSINSIATSASLWLDMRSESRDALAELEKRVRAAVEDLTSDALAFDIEVVGDRPAGHLSPEHPLVRMAMAALKHIGMPAALEKGSTDANIPLADGCPAVTIGITRGGNAHRLDEFIETVPVAAGLRQLILLALALAQWNGVRDDG